MGIGREILGQPTDSKGFKFPILVFLLFETPDDLGLLSVFKHANDRDKGVRECWVIAVVLRRKRDDEVAITSIRSLTQLRPNLCFDAAYDLSVKRHIIVRKINLSRMGRRESKARRHEGTEGEAHASPIRQ